MELESRTVPSTVSLPLVNRTGLDPARYSVYVLGFSTASQMELQSDGQFGATPAGSGAIPSYQVGTGAGRLSQITLDLTASLIGARLYFFIVAAGAPNTPPSLPYTGGGASVVQPTNPPGSNYPPFDIVEITAPGSDALPTIDVQTVDGFIFPISLTLNGGLGQVGQPVYPPGHAPLVNRADIISAYQAFMTRQGVAGAPYQDLLFDGTNPPWTVAGQRGGIVNPGSYLAAGANPGSPLNHAWDGVLTTLFQTPGRLVGMVGDDGAFYRGTPTQLGSQWVLHFVGYTDAACTLPNGNAYDVYSPLTPDPLGPYQTNETAGEMVFANDGVFADVSANVVLSGPASVALGLQRDIVSALNRGVALLAPTDGVNGSASTYWGTETNWYPAGQTQNLFSRFMHTGQVRGQNIFVLPPGAVADAQGELMGQAYGFGYDENPGHGPAGQPNVPSKFDPVPAGTTTVTVTLGPWVPSTTFAVGTGPGGPGVVRDYGPPDALVKRLAPFGNAFRGGVRVATGDVTGDGVEDVIVAQGPGGGTVVKVYDGANFKLTRQFRAFPELAARRNRVGVFVASADVNGDGYDDVITGAGFGWLPLVRVYSGKNGALLRSFLAFSPAFRGGVCVAAGDVNDDGFGDVVTASRRGSRVRVWDGRTFRPRLSFDAFPGPGTELGVYVAVGDVEGDHRLEIVVGTGARTAGEVRVFDAATGKSLGRVFRNAGLREGLRVAVFDTNGDGKDEVLVGRGAGGRSVVWAWQFMANTSKWLRTDAFAPFGPAFDEGVFLG